MYFKVRCLREPIRILLCFASFLFPFSLLRIYLQNIILRLFSESINDALALVLSTAGAGVIFLACSALLGLYKVYEFTDRELQILWWYGGWLFYFNILPLQQAPPHARWIKDESPLQERDSIPSLRGFPDEFEPEIITEQLARGVQPDAVLGTGRRTKTIPRSELWDVKIFESVFGATLLLRLRGCGEFTERFVWQYRLHNRGRLFVIRLSKSRGEQAYSQIKEFVRR